MFLHICETADVTVHLFVHKRINCGPLIGHPLLFDVRLCSIIIFIFIFIFIFFIFLSKFYNVSRRPYNVSHGWALQRL